MSIIINNFSIDTGYFKYCSSLVDFSVDVTDTVNIITTSGTYFTANGLDVTTTLSGIPSGYRLTYSTVPSGNISLIAKASNDGNYSLEKEYGLQFGYEIFWNEVNYWNPLQEVPIFVITKNNSTPSNISYFSTFFETINYRDTDLEVLISADGSGKLDLSSTIIPQSTWFFNGKTYSITVSGIKDFAGNELLPETFMFTIEK